MQLLFSCRQKPAKNPMQKLPKNPTKIFDKNFPKIWWDKNFYIFLNINTNKNLKHEHKIPFTP